MGPNVLLMHVVLQKGVHAQVRPLSTAQRHYSVESLPPSQSAQQANRAYSYGSGGRV